jgi:hypothetical protein
MQKAGMQEKVLLDVHFGVAQSPKQSSAGRV